MLVNNVEIPYLVHGIFPQPMTGHKDKCRYMMKYGFLCLPVGIADPEERRRYIETHLFALRQGRLPSQLYYLFLAVGVLPIYLIQVIMKLTTFQSSLVTDVALPFKELKFDDYELEEFKFANGYTPGRIWFGISSVSYGGQIQIQTMFPKDTIFRENPDAFLGGIVEEINNLATSHLV